MERPVVKFRSGNPLFLFREAAEAACQPTHDELREYPMALSRYWSEKFADACVPDFLRAMQLHPPVSREDPSKMLTFTYGAQHGLTLMADHMLKSTQRVNLARQHHGKRELAPVILTPSPNYTFHFEYFHSKGIRVRYIERDIENGWALRPEQVRETLRELREDNRSLVVGYYDSNPNNPTGRIRDVDETASLAEVFHAHNRAMADLDKACDINPAERGRSTHRLHILDDMVHLGLEHVAKRPASFIANPQTQDDTVIFLGVSKYGIPGLRGGLVVSGPEIRRSLFRSFWTSVGYANVSSLIAVSETFSGEQNRLFAREQHLEKLNAAHWYGFELFRALVNGVTPEFLDNPLGTRIMGDVHKVIHDKEICRSRLLRGIPGLSVSAPEAGFFALLNAQSLQGSFIPAEAQLRAAGDRVLSVSTLHKFLYAHGVDCLQGSTCGLKPDKLIERASVGLPPRQIVEGLERIRMAVESLQPPSACSKSKSQTRASIITPT